MIFREGAESVERGGYGQMTGMSHKRLRIGSLALMPSLAVLLAASDGALAIDTRYRDYGPIVQDGPTLDSSMLVANANIEGQYGAEELIARLQAPVVDQQRMTEVARAALLPSFGRPEPVETDFGLAVSDDRSLKESLIAFSLERATTGGDLFLQIAEAASAPGRAVDGNGFSLVAAMLGDRWSTEELRQEVEQATTAFDTPVTDDPTLQGSVIALNDRIQELEAQELVLTAQGPPSVTGASFALAMSSY
jgi:hypothetical protein